jgi:ribosomal protein S18 acetylase RimI-like enzyme
MLIREAKFQDTEQIAYVHVGSWRTTYMNIISDDFLSGLSIERRKKSWEWTFNNLNKDEKIFVFEDNGKIVGFVNGGRNRSVDYNYDSELYAIYLLEEYQGKGYGRQLFNKLVGELIERGYDSMMLWVLEANSSIRFYERLGGIVLGRKTEKIGDQELVEVAFGWNDLKKNYLEGNSKKCPKEVKP